jgi:hypothetical protein
MGQKVIYDFLCHYNNNSVMSPMSDAMNSLIIYGDSPISYLSNIENEPLLLNFFQKLFLCDDSAYFYDIMFKCTDTPSRKNAGKIAAKSLN